MYAVRSNVFCEYPAAALRFEYVASVASTVPELFNTWTFNVSYAVVVVVSAVSIWSQNVRVAAVAFAGMVTCWYSVSVCAVP